MADGGAPITKAEAEVLLEQLRWALASLEAVVMGLTIEIHAHEEPTDDEWQQYEAMRVDEEINPRRERHDDEVADRLDAINDDHIAAWEGA